MNRVLHVSRSGLSFNRASCESGGESGLAIILGPENSKSLGAGIAVYDRCCVEWTVLYDEVIVVLSGIFKMRYGDALQHSLSAYPGDVIWLPKFTHLTYEGEAAEIFYALYPVNWRQLNNT